MGTLPQEQIGKQGGILLKYDPVDIKQSKLDGKASNKSLLLYSAEGKIVKALYYPGINATVKSAISERHFRKSCSKNSAGPSGPSRDLAQEPWSIFHLDVRCFNPHRQFLLLPKRNAFIRHTVSPTWI